MKKAFFEGNRKRITGKLEKDSLLILFAGKAPRCSADEYFPFIPNKNFYYLTGIEENKIILLITKRESIIKEILFIQRPDPVKERWLGKSITGDEAQKRSGIKEIMFLDQFDSHFSNLLSFHGFQSLYLDLFENDPEDENTTARIFANMVQKKYPQLTIKNTWHQIRDCRMIKQPEEISCIKKALAITKAGIEQIISKARPGMMEYEIEAFFDFELTSNGRYKKSFDSIMASGKNATVLHYCSNDSKVNPGSLVLLDLGAAYKHYCADISRVFPIDGKFTERQKIIYFAVLKAQRAVINAIRPGTTPKNLNKIAEKALAQECKKMGLIKKARNYQNIISMEFHIFWG